MLIKCKFHSYYRTTEALSCLFFMSSEIGVSCNTTTGFCSYILRLCSDTASMFEYILQVKLTKYIDGCGTFSNLTYGSACPYSSRNIVE